MARKKRKTMRQKYDMWLGEHVALSYAIIACSVAAALVGLFLFVTFSGFGSSADFIYNQF